MSFKKNIWPHGMYSGETWQNEGQRQSRTLPSCRSTSMRINEMSDKRKCLYGQRSFSESEEDAQFCSGERLQTLLNSSVCADARGSEDINTDGRSNKEIISPGCFTNTGDDYEARAEKETRCESEETSEVENNDNDEEPLFDPIYMNIRYFNYSSEGSVSCSMENISHSSNEMILGVSNTFENVEYMTAESCRNDRISSQMECVYAVPKCNCISIKKPEQLCKTGTNHIPNPDKPNPDKLSDQMKALDSGCRESTGYVCMDSYIQMNAIPQTIEKDKYHIYENNKDWLNNEGDPAVTNSTDNRQSPKRFKKNGKTKYDAPSMLGDSQRLVNRDEVAVAEEALAIDSKEDKCKRLSSQSLRRKSRLKHRQCLDRNLLEATLAQQKVDGGPVNTDVAKEAESIDQSSTLSDTPNAGQIEIIHDKMRQFRRQIYIPNIHPKLIKFLRSSSARRRHLEEDIARKGFDIVWPQTEEGILFLEPSLSTESPIRLSNASTEDEIAKMFYKRLRNYFVDDSICSAREICEDLTALLALTPLVTNCAMYNERMNWFIIGGKESVEDCKRQLLALIKFLEMRLKASGTHKITKTKFMTKHAVRIVLESKILDKFRSQFETLKVDFGDDFEHIKFRGEINAVDSAIQELHGYLQTVQGSVYKCSALIRRLLNNTKVKSYLQELLRSHSLICAWRTAEDTCFVYGTSPEDVQSVKNIFKRVLVSETIELSEGQNELMKSRLGRTEIKVMIKTYEGFLEVEISDSSMEIACTRRIQEEVRGRLKKFSYRHEVIKTAQKVESGLFKLFQRYHFDKLTSLKQRCKNILVELNIFEEKFTCGFILTGKRDFCKIAVRELENVLATVTSFEHTIKRVGLISFLQSEEGRAQMSTLESKNQCIVHFSDGSPVSQNKVCVCQYDDRELIVLQGDISDMTTGLAYIPCQPCKQMRSQADEEMPRQLVARECMISPDTKHVNKSNFFACIPNTETWGTEMYDAVKASVCLCLREAKIREIPSVAFSVSTPPKEFPPAEYTKLLVETAKGFLESEGQSTKLQRVVFCAKDGIHINGFVEALQNAFNRKTVQVSGSICGSSNVLSYSELTKNTDSNMYCTTTDLDDIEPEKDNRTTVDVNLVNDDITAVKVDAIFLPAREPVSLPQNISNMNSNACTTGNIKEHLQTKFPSGLATGEITSVTLDGFICDLAYFANLGPPTKNTDIRRKVLDTVIRGVLDRCIEDEIEALAIIPYGIGIYLLTEVIFNTLQPFLCENCILERIDIIVDPRDRSSYLPFEEMKRQFYDKVTPHDGIDSPKNEDSQLGGNVTNTPLTAEESNESLSFSEGTVKVDLLMGDITKETTDVIVNSVHGNLDLSASRLAKAVSDAAGTDIQTDLKTKQNLSNIRRDGVVVTGPGKLKCKFIFHVKFKGSIEGWKTVISICLQHAETIGMTSLAFPALGTGRKGIKPHFFAKSVLKCIRKFSATNPKSLHEIRIVIFEEAMFQKVLQTANAFRARKRRHTLKDKFYEMLKKESPRQVEDEVRLQVYTVVDNVDNVKKQLDKLCLKASSEG